ncbi:prepilin-type N-terminal cleavage/methylation domain-containing protein [Candidatus Roizmanbacteria bacterium]|nr:prepilin-type N-terminal cleavage/methylation domain-containing protein [Candidatus Roizmanbacteria bacterium]
MVKRRLGFTLIELLIVIALLGALAVGLLAALDPFEQLKKGTDTGTRNTVGEFQGGVIRYYAIKNQMPWCGDDTCSTILNSVAGAAPVTLESMNTVPGTIKNITDTGELKTDFANLAGGQLKNIWVTGTNDPPVVRVCFKPTSKSFMADPNTKYGPDGTTPYTPLGGLCPNNVAGQCYYCIQ